MTLSPYLVAATILLSATANTHAQGLAEDFSSDPFSVRSYTDNLGSDSDGISLAANGTSVNLRATTNNDNRGKITFATTHPGNINELSITGMLSSATEFDSGVTGKAKTEMSGYFYNDIQENGLGDENRTGDSQVSIAMELNNDGSAYAYACFQRRNADGSKSPIPGTQNSDGGNCTGFANFPQLDKLHTLTIGYDKSTAEVYAIFDEERIGYSINTGHHTAQNPFSEIAFRAQGTSTVAVGSLHSIRSNVFEVNNFSSLTGDQVYKTVYGDDDITVVDGKLRLAIESDGSTESQTNRAFRALGETDYVEALLSLSSDSTLNGTGFNTIRLRNTFYNEAQNGGTGDDGTGTARSDVFTSLNLSMNENREVAADVLVVRADSGDWSATTALSNDPDDPFPVLKTGLAVDTEYLASIQLDKTANRIIFKIADAEHVYDIQSPIFTASFVDGAGVDTRITGAGKTVGFADDFRNNPNALTSEEQPTTGGETTGGGTGDTTSGSSDSESGGGCSITSAGSSTSFMVLMALLVSFLKLRRRIPVLNRSARKV